MTTNASAPGPTWRLPAPRSLTSLRRHHGRQPSRPVVKLKCRCGRVVQRVQVFPVTVMLVGSIRGGIIPKNGYPFDPAALSPGETETGWASNDRLSGPCPNRRCGEHHDRRVDRLDGPCRAAVEQGRRELTLGVDL